MKKISAVICELNPAHRGHQFIINEAKKRGEYVIAVMSGNFVQRGENAIFDKYERAEDALNMGVDLVVEIPFPWCSSSAEFFASAGVEIAESMGTEILVFGSESGDKEGLMRAGELLKREEFNRPIPPNVRAAEYRERLLYQIDPTLPPFLLALSNDILGVEYCKNVKKAEPCPIKRISCDSASQIRKAMYDSKLKELNALFAQKLFDMEYHKFRTLRNPVLDFAECGGGIGDRLIDCANRSTNGDQMLKYAGTRNFTDSRFRRAALFALLEVKPEEIREHPLFTIVLGFNDRGREILSDMRRQKSIEVLTKPADGKLLKGKALKQFELAAFADSVYAACAGLPSDHFIKKSPGIH